MVKIIADCCGGSGAYVRLLKKLTDGTLKIKNINSIRIVTTAYSW